MDTFEHCNESLAEILKSDATCGILCDIGMPVLHQNVRYNCRIFCLDQKILLIRPKMVLCDDGNYRESRHFTSWKRANQVDQHQLPPVLVEATGGQAEVPFGQGAVGLANTLVAAETCEELWSPASPHIEQSLAGVEIIGNGSGSHHQLRKLDTRLNYMVNATVKCGGVYLYANQKGCDGSRLYYDGGAMVVANGRVLAQAAQFSLRDVEVVTATVSLEEVRAKRANMSSLQEQSSGRPKMPTASQGARAGAGRGGAGRCRRRLLLPPPCYYHTPEEECGFGPACWLWDYLRRSGAGGFMLPLSGGADSSATAAIVGVMCYLVHEEVLAGNEQFLGQSVKGFPFLPCSRPLPHQVLSDLRRVVREPDFAPARPSEIAERVLHTCYMGKGASSSKATERRAAAVAAQLGCHHATIWIDAAFRGVLEVFRALTGREPRFNNQGGTEAEDLALQNIQARIRMVLTYLLAQLTPWVRGRSGFLLVLGSANVDEGLRGYMTKYDCSSADLNPIGSISKLDLKRLLTWAARRFGWPALAEVEGAPPTAELRPNLGGEGEEHTQLDEEDMGMSYAELGDFGRLRMLQRCGPVSMFRTLCVAWRGQHTPSIVAEKVKRFFRFYSINRHKMTTVTPSYHAEQYSPDDNRFDHRQFLYNTRWPRQFRKIDLLVQEIDDSKKDHASAIPERR
ncbi:unnamed protein product [Heterosigma akashiwo]